MIYLHITDLLLSLPVTHDSTDWQVSRDLQFTDIVAQSIGDTSNLTSILFNNSLDPLLDYYARSRVLLSTGYTEWSSIDIFKPSDVRDQNLNMPLPSLVTLPIVSITNSGIDVPIMGTNIALSPVSTLGGALHESTSYILEDMDGRHVWDSMYNLDKLTKTIPAEVLSPGTAYRLRILIHTDSRDTSQLITRTIKTAARTKGFIMTGLVNVNPAIDLNIDIGQDITLTGAVGHLYAILNYKEYLVGDYIAGGVGNNLIVIPTADLKPFSKYLIRVTTNDPAVWDQRVFRTN